ncbi:MAG TPA: type IX secretion system protein PorQ [Bacteroidales bacterium]|nr:type IX secretion system protein PorQ [Bacteroidales bacterium]
MNKVFLLILLGLYQFSSSAQTGGDHVYEFLNLTHSGLVTSLGGSNVSITGDNLNLSYHNPALLSSSMDRALALDYVNYFAGINYGQAMYSRSFGNTGNFSAGITYLSYGSFTEASPAGVITGSFSASEYAMSFIWSRNIDSLLSIGIDFKPVLSHLDEYTSLGFAFDLGLSWHDRNNRFSAGFVIRNAGLELTTYAGEQREKLPFELMAGASYRLPYAPLRFSMTLRHLERYELSNESTEPGTGTTEGANDNKFIDNTLRHIIPGVELIPHRNFYLSAGYNIQRRKEMQVLSRGSAAGFTWGFGINTTIMNIEFGRAIYHLAGATTNISLILRTDRFYRKDH